MVSMVGLGGYHLVRPELPEAESIRIVRAAIDNRLDFLDNCWDYNGGQSEVRMGKALRDGYRQRAFLMTKIDGREKKTSLATKALTSIRDRCQPSIPFRHRSDAAERDGRSLRQLRKERPARAGEERYRRARDETDGRSISSSKAKR
jgi:aryl-alcohol dehydrogenase-like predicted oxidoreductase